MRILLVNINFHRKNCHALLSYKNIQVAQIYDINQIHNINLSEFDCVYSPSLPIDISKYPNTKFLFGPHFSVFPDERVLSVIGPNSRYNQLSTWTVNSWKIFDIVKNLNLIELPFGVDTDAYCEIKPIQERSYVFIYYKSRNPNELQFVRNILDKQNISYRIFSYTQKYHEQEYLHFLRESKYGIWIGRHESQGFALQEALSSNVPLLVWDVSSMNQEYGYNYNDIPATAIPYWDERCGEYFHKADEFEEKFKLFVSKLDSYRPREYIMENLSMAKCEERLIQVVDQMKSEK
jgi:hypothetical protein